MADDSSIMNYVMLGVAILAVPVVVGYIIGQSAIKQYLQAVGYMGGIPGTAFNAGFSCRRGRGPEGAPLDSQDRADCSNLLAAANNPSQLNTREQETVRNFMMGYNSV